jgi:HK97 gp10 family phage protein
MSANINIKSAWHGEEVKVQGHKVVNKSIWEVGLIVEGQAKELCPVDYGYLKASINTQSRDQGTELGQVVSRKVESKVQTIGKKTKLEDLHEASHQSFFENMPEHFQKIQKPNGLEEVLVGTAVEYAPYICFGTSKMSAQPFLRPALALAQGKVLTIVQVNGKLQFKEYLQ